MRRLFAVLILLTGCDLYWNQGDDDCKYYDTAGAAPDIAPYNELRNPVTGQCENYGGGGWGCDDPCAPCAAEDGRGAPQANPDWGQCYSTCNALDEGACLTTSGCLATYDEKTQNNLPQAATFRGCFETAPSGPLSTGTCIGLDAHSCSVHDNCAMYYDQGFEFANFTRCAPEPTITGCTNVDCGANYHCESHCTDPANQQCGAVCVPDGDICANVDCGPGYACVETCITPTPTHVGQCYGTCEAQTACAMLPDEAACTARGDCTSVYNGEDCTCYPNGGCTCQILTYDRCEAH